MTLPRYRKAILASTALSALLLTAACGGSDDDASASPSSAATSSPSSSKSSDTSSDSSSGSYKAGSYEAEGSYANPGGQSSVKVALTLETDGTISAVEVTPEASGTSLQYQEKFVSGISAEVKGKSIDELDVSKVAGSSLTSQGFNAAVDTIKGEAAA